MSVHPTPAQMARAAEMVEGLKLGSRRFDLEGFWASNDRALKDPFAPDCPQLPLGIRMEDVCVAEELGVGVSWRRFFQEDSYHAELCRMYNDRSAETVGRRLLPEHLEPDPAAPAAVTLADLFESRSEWRDESGSYRLHPAASSPDELESLLDRVDERLRRPHEAILPRDSTLDRSLPYRHQRGPVTFATTVYGAENLVFLVVDRPELAARFRDTITRAILARAKVMDEAAGLTNTREPRGWSWADDDSALLDPEMYRVFGLPILRAIFERYAPAPGDRRFLHSDTDIGHLLPILKTVNFSAVNLGPNLTIKRIRAHLPDTVIHGQLAPLTFSGNERVRMVAETIRDFEQARDERGVVFETAGRVAQGSRLAGLRLIMETIDGHCRFERVRGR